MELAGDTAFEALPEGAKLCVVNNLAYWREFGPLPLTAAEHRFAVELATRLGGTCRTLIEINGDIEMARCSAQARWAAAHPKR